MEISNSKSLSEKVIDAILEKIQKGELKLGQKLKTEDELAKEFGVSRTSIREAIQKLKTIGVIDVKRGKGSYLCEEPSLESIRNVLPVILFSTSTTEDITKHLLQARLIIEPKIAKLAAKNISGEKLNQLEKLLQNLMKSAENGDAEAFFEHDLAFHLTVARGTNNPVLLFLLKTLKTVMFKQFEDVYSDVGFKDSSIELHREIFKALKDGDQDRAEDAIYKSIKIAYEGYGKDDLNEL